MESLPIQPHSAKYSFQPPSPPKKFQTKKTPSIAALCHLPRAYSAIQFSVGLIVMLRKAALGMPSVALTETAFLLYRA